MCFSATASFGAGGALVLIGAAGLIKVKDRSQLMLAATPVIFGLQQITEGVVWSCIGRSEAQLCQQISTNVFIAVAQILWPVWIPLTAITLEKNALRMKIIWGTLFIGLLIASYLSYRIVFNPFTSIVVNHHIQYQINYERTFLDQWHYLYLVPTVGALIASSRRQVQFLGILFFMAFLFSKMFYDQLVISVWCFFAAIISIYIFFIKLPDKHQ